MECTCVIDPDIGGSEYIELKSKWTTAVRTFRCCECKRKMPAGKRHWLDVMKTEEDDLSLDDIDIFRTCVDCKSVRDNIFCNFYFKMLWEMIDNHLDDGDSIPEECIAKLTPKAMEMVCEAIEEHWEKDNHEA